MKIETVSSIFIYDKIIYKTFDTKTNIMFTIKKLITKLPMNIRRMGTINRSHFTVGEGAIFGAIIGGAFGSSFAFANVSSLVEESSIERKIEFKKIMHALKIKTPCGKEMRMYNT